MVLRSWNLSLLFAKISCVLFTWLPIPPNMLVWGSALRHLVCWFRWRISNGSAALCPGQAFRCGCTPRVRAHRHRLPSLPPTTVWWNKRCGYRRTTRTRTRRRWRRSRSARRNSIAARTTEFGSASSRRSKQLVLIVYYNVLMWNDYSFRLLSSPGSVNEYIFD